MSVTIRDVARRAGVSTATVSRILSGASASRPATVAAVRTAVAALDFRPSGIARSLKLQSTQTLGLIVTDVQNPFFPELVRAVEDVAREFGFAILLCNGARQPEREGEYLALLEERRVDGIIVAASHVTDQHATWFATARIPVVSVNSETGDLSVPAILSDNLEGGRTAADHLLSLGHRQIAVLAGPPTTGDAVRRVEGARAAIAAAGLDPSDLCVVAGDGTVEGGKIATLEVLRVRPDVTGLVCYNDLTAIGALRAIRALRRSVPGDVSVVGFDDIDAAAWVEPPLTTVAQQKAAMGRWAVERIARHLREGLPWNPPERVVLPVALRVRGSTARVRPDDAPA